MHLESPVAEDNVDAWNDSDKTNARGSGWSAQKMYQIFQLVWVSPSCLPESSVSTCCFCTRLIPCIDPEHTALSLLWQVQLDKLFSSLQILAKLLFNLRCCPTSFCWPYYSTSLGHEIDAMILRPSTLCKKQLGVILTYLTRQHRADIQSRHRRLCINCLEGCSEDRKQLVSSLQAETSQP